MRITMKEIEKTYRELIDWEDQINSKEYQKQIEPAEHRKQADAKSSRVCKDKQNKTDPKCWYRKSQDQTFRRKLLFQFGIRP